MGGASGSHRTRPPSRIHFRSSQESWISVHCSRHWRRTGIAAGMPHSARAPFSAGIAKGLCERPHNLVRGPRAGYGRALRRRFSKRTAAAGCEVPHRRIGASTSGPITPCLRTTEASAWDRPHWRHSRTGTNRGTLMHELSIAMSIVEMAEEEADQRGGVQVNAVHLKLGPLSGVVKDALLSSYELACEGTQLEGSQLVIEEIPSWCIARNARRRALGFDAVVRLSRMQEPRIGSTSRAGTPSRRSGDTGMSAQPRLGGSKTERSQAERHRGSRAPAALSGSWSVRGEPGVEPGLRQDRLPREDAYAPAAQLTASRLWWAISRPTTTRSGWRARRCPSSKSRPARSAIWKLPWSATP